jgi:hypothetical protein
MLSLPAAMAIMLDSRLGGPCAVGSTFSQRRNLGVFSVTSNSDCEFPDWC